jgi:hypothetical protein
MHAARTTLSREGFLHPNLYQLVNKEKFPTPATPPEARY